MLVLNLNLESIVRPQVREASITFSITFYNLPYNLVSLRRHVSLSICAKRRESIVRPQVRDRSFHGLLLSFYNLL